MSDEKDAVVARQPVQHDQVTTLHLFYLGGLLIEGLSNFHEDIISNYKNVHEIAGRLSYVRVLELKSKFEQAVLLVDQQNV